MPMDQLPRLQRWLAEHGADAPAPEELIAIQSTDDPGWVVVIDIAQTSLADRPFEPVEEAPDPLTGLRWFSCSIEDGAWVGAGDETQLARILETFLDWSNSRAPRAG